MRNSIQKMIKTEKYKREKSWKNNDKNVEILYNMLRFENETQHITKS